MLVEGSLITEGSTDHNRYIVNAVAMEVRKLLALRVQRNQKSMIAIACLRCETEITIIRVRVRIMKECVYPVEDTIFNVWK